MARQILWQSRICFKKKGIADFALQVRFAKVPGRRKESLSRQEYATQQPNPMFPSNLSSATTLMMDRYCLESAR
jgi:hypothetical protein